MGVKKIIKLILAIIILLLIATTIVIVCKKVVKQTKMQDLITDLLLIQGKAKTYTENVSVETANLDETKEEDNTKIEEVKEQKLKGTALEKCEENIKNVAQKAGIQDMKEYYYLTQEDLNSMGVNIQVEKDTYYLVKYNFEDTEVVYTKGYEYEGKTYYKLSELKNLELKK